MLLNDLGRTILPSVFKSLNAAGIVDTMTIVAESAVTIGTGGERIKGTAADAYEDVPVSYEPTATNSTSRTTAGDKAVSSAQYTLTFPVHMQNGDRIEIDPKSHRLIVNSRGDEPVKTFRIIRIRDVSGVVFEAVCEREG